MIRLVTILYFIIGAINLISLLFGWNELNLYTKPLLMPVLIYFLFVSAKEIISLPRLLAAGALIFSWIGDVILMFDEDKNLFLAGLGSFLIAQLIYAYALSKASFKKIEFELKPIIPLLLYGFLLLLALVRNSGDLAPAIVIYGVCILIMLSIARLRRWGTNTESYKLAFIGAFLFVISDSILGLNKFVFNIPVGEFFVMATYIPAQYYLIRGLLSHTV